MSRKGVIDLKLPLSVLDLSPIASGSTGSQALQNTFSLARLADRLGYTRFWLAEHHNSQSIASSSPEIMIGQVARETTRIRVGSGGIMLPNHASLKVAESFSTLEALFPGRIDLGIGRAPGTDQMTAQALRGARRSLGAEDFPAQLDDLFSFSTGRFPVDHPYRQITAIPHDVPLPPVWLLGSSDYSAQLSGELGLGFAFAAHFSTLDPVDVMQVYRKSFTPSEYLSKPKSILTVSVICAETAQRADYLAATVDLFWVLLASGRLRSLPSPDEALAFAYTPMERLQTQARRAMHIIGDPTTVRAKIIDLAERTGADEVMVTSNVHSHTERLRSYELLADAFELK
jgi:luciferase family oxidoreductase group 1